MFNRLTQRFLSIGIEHRNIVRGLLLVALFTLAGKAVGAAKEVAIAYKFGLSEIVDVYVLAFTFAIWIPVMASTVLNSIYVPLIHKLDPEEKECFIRQFTGMGLVVSGLVTLLLLVVLPLITDFMSDQFSPEARNALHKLAVGFSPIAGLGFLAALFSSMLLAEERHSNTLLETIPSLTLIIFILLWPASKSINPLLWGTILGVVLQALGLLILLLNARLFKHRPVFSFQSPGWQRFRQDIGIVLLGQFVMSFVEPVSAVIAADLGPGNVAGLGYSNRVLALFLTLGATAIARAILPVLSKSQNNNQIRLGIQWSIIMFACGTVAAIIAWQITPQLVKLLLERGAFTEENTTEVSKAIRFGVLQFPFYFSGIVLAQLFISLRLYVPILISAVLAVTMKVIFSLLLAPKYMFAGIVLANIPMYAATNLLFFATIWYLHKKGYQRQ